MTTINRISGLASGLDTDTIVKNLVKVAQAPVDKLKQERQIWQWKQEDYRKINTSLLNLRNQVFNLKMQSAFKAMKATSSDEAVLKAQAASTASEGVYEVEVVNLAKAASSVSSSSIAAAGKTVDPTKTLAELEDSLDVAIEWEEGTGTRTAHFSINGVAFEINENMTLNQVISKVNSSQTAGVTMFFDSSTGRMSVMAKKTGDYNQGAAEIDVEGQFLTGVLKLSDAEGTDATFNLNGITGITSNTNSYTANGVTFQFQKAAPGQTITVTVKSDVDSIVQTIKSFVDAYNQVISDVNAKLTEARPKDEKGRYYLPLTDEERQQLKDSGQEDKISQLEAMAKTGLLRNDSLLTAALSSMRLALGGVVSGLEDKVTITKSGSTIEATANQLSVIGITTGSWSERGKLYLDENRLREALNSNPEAVMKLFTNSSDTYEEKGIAQRLYDAINTAVTNIGKKAGSSYSAVDTSEIGNKVRTINERIAKLEDRIAMLEDRYWSQFTRLEQYISKTNAQSMWLANIFANKQ